MASGAVCWRLYCSRETEVLTLMRGPAEKARQRPLHSDVMCLAGRDT